MPESFPTEPKTSSSTVKAPTNPRASNSGSGQLPPWLTLAALAVAVIAVILAVLAWVRPSFGSDKFSAAETDEAKSHICEVTGTVRQATSLNTNMTNPDPNNPIGGLAIAANARLALYGGGAFVLERLDAEPATPADLAKAATAMAHTMQELSINYLAGANADSPVQQPLRDELQEQLNELNDLCQ